MKIFVSYSRSDAGDFADQIQRHIGNFGHYEVFIDERSIGVGEIWSHTIETNISNCDIFVAIITYGALRSRHVEKEVLQAQTEKKTIIPCFHRDVRKEDIKWGLNKIQGIVFKKEFDLARDLYTKLKEIPSPKPVARTPIQPEKRRWLFLSLLLL
jgi:TIR domain